MGRGGEKGKEEEAEKEEAGDQRECQQAINGGYRVVQRVNNWRAEPNVPDW